MTIVCAGVKSILDVQATLERLETLNVCVLGYGTDRFPGFYLADSGFPVPWRVDTPEEVAAVMRVQAALGAWRPRDRGRQPAARGRSRSIPRCTTACSPTRSRPRRPRASAAGRRTPFLLDRFHRETGGATLEANVALVRRNAELAARIARADAEGS